MFAFHNEAHQVFWSQTVGVCTPVAIPPGDQTGTVPTHDAVNHRPSGEFAQDHVARD